MVERIPAASKTILMGQSQIEEGNMSFARGDCDLTQSNRRAFLDKSGLKLENLVMGALSHGSRCQVVRKSDAGKGAFSLDTAFPATDALLTSETGLILGITTADCLPIFLWSAEGEVIGLAHAGWKGLAKGVVKNLIDTALKFQPVPSDKLFIRIGIGIGACCYTVEVERLKLFNDYHWCEIHWREDEKVHLDLAAIAVQQAVQSGIHRQNIGKWEGCACCGQKYPSYRREGGNFQPDLAVIVCKNQEN